MKSHYVLCDHACPLAETCARYCPEMNRRRTDHIDPMPFDARRHRCGFFLPREEDTPIEPSPSTTPHEQ